VRATITCGAAALAALTIYSVPASGYASHRSATAMCHGHPADIVGTSHADHILASGEQVIVARGGDDVIHGAGAIICAGPGNDRINEAAAGGGVQVIYGGPGDDRVRAGDESDTVYGGPGNDWIDGGTRNDFLHGGAGNDVMRSGAHRTGTAGNNDTGDLFYADPGHDRLIGGPPAPNGDQLDTLVYPTSAAAATVDLRTGKAFSRSTGHDTLRLITGVDGTDNADVIRGNGRPNLIYGEAGDDRLFGRGGDDRLYGGDGQDRGNGGGDSDQCVAETVTACES
jgi:Ca2+-binding RTX toxin-like protein